MLAIVDNYDSFTFNLVQYFGELGQEVMVFRNDAISLLELEKLKPDYLVISPGPCTPDKAGISLDAIPHFAGKIPILGVCLGHQSIAQAYGAEVIKAQSLMHGKVSPINHNGSGLFHTLENPFKATRYHSLGVREDSLPTCLEVTAHTDDGEIMGLQHRTLPISGVQFHPESIETEYGRKLLDNFLALNSEFDP